MGQMVYRSMLEESGRGGRMKITTYRVKQYNSTYKTVVCVDGKPICIVAGVGKTLSNVIAYLNGYDADIADGKIKIALDRYKTERDDKE